VQLTSLSPMLIDRLLVLETDAAHLTVLAAVADACAYVARGKADAAQRSLSELKVFLTLLPEGAKLELKAPRPGAAEPAQRLGVRLRPVSRSDREPPLCPVPPSPVPTSFAMPPQGPATTPTPTSAPGPAPG
jgi:hypothetical protein